MLYYIIIIIIIPTTIIIIIIIIITITTTIILIIITITTTIIFPSYSQARMHRGRMSMARRLSLLMGCSMLSTAVRGVARRGTIFATPQGMLHHISTYLHII